jgi:hypothetical protein
VTGRKDSTARRDARPTVCLCLSRLTSAATGCPCGRPPFSWGESDEGPVARCTAHWRISWRGDSRSRLCLGRVLKIYIGSALHPHPGPLPEGEGETLPVSWAKSRLPGTIGLSRRAIEPRHGKLAWPSARGDARPTYLCVSGLMSAAAGSNIKYLAVRQHRPTLLDLTANHANGATGWA